MVFRDQESAMYEELMNSILEQREMIYNFDKEISNRVCKLSSNIILKKPRHFQLYKKYNN